MPISPLRDPNRIIVGDSAGNNAVSDKYLEDAANKARTEGAARRLRMGATTAPPGVPPPATEALRAASKATNPAARAAAAVTDAAKGVGSKVKALPGQALRGVARFGAAGALAEGAVGAAREAGDADYDARFGIHSGNSLNNPVLRGLGIPETVLNRALPNTGNATLDNVLQGANRLPIDALGAVSSTAANTANTIGKLIPGMPEIGFADQPRMRAQAPNPPAAVTAVQGSGGAGASPLRAQGTYTTGDGRTGVLPAGITVAQGKNGPAFGGGQTAESQQLLQQGYAGQAAPSTSPLRAPDLNAMGSGFNQAPSRAGDINKYFDGLAKQIQDLHGSAKFGANGSLATKLLELEKARANALGQNAGQLIDSQGNQVTDLGNKRSNAANIYGTDVGERSSLRRDNALVASARVKAASDALQTRQEMSEKQLQLLDDRATAAATDGDGKVDPVKKQAFMDAATVNFGGAFDGSAGTLGESAAEGADAATMAEVVGNLNKGVGAGNESASLPRLGRLREPTLGEAFDSRSNVTLRDVVRRGFDGLPFVDDSRVYEAEDPSERRVLRARDTTRDQRQTLRRRKQLSDNEE